MHLDRQRERRIAADRTSLLLLLICVHTAKMVSYRPTTFFIPHRWLIWLTWLTWREVNLVASLGVTSSGAAALANGISMLVTTTMERLTTHSGISFSCSLVFFNRTKCWNRRRRCLTHEEGRRAGRQGGR